MAMHLSESLVRWGVHGQVGVLSIYATRGSPGPISMLLIGLAYKDKGAKCLLLLLQVSGNPILARCSLQYWIQWAEKPMLRERLNSAVKLAFPKTFQQRRSVATWVLSMN